MEWDEQTVMLDPSLAENRSATLWRYTNLPRFINLITESALFCQRMDLFEDPYEGRLSKSSRAGLGKKPDGITRGTPLFESRGDLIEELRKVTYLNSWRIDEYEDYGMWHAYTDPSSGLAIKTSVGSLIEAIEDGGEFEGRVAIEKVDYIESPEDPQTSVGEGVFSPFRFKRIQHRNEREMRLLVTDYPHGRTQVQESFTAPDDRDAIRQIPVNPATLVEEIRLRPESESPLERAVENLLAMDDSDIDTGRVEHSSLEGLGQ